MGAPINTPLATPLSSRKNNKKKKALRSPPPWKSRHSPTMALKAVHVSDVPCLDQVPENASLGLYSTRFSTGKLFLFLIPLLLLFSFFLVFVSKVLFFPFQALMSVGHRSEFQSFW